MLTIRFITHHEFDGLCEDVNAKYVVFTMDGITISSHMKRAKEVHDELLQLLEPSELMARGEQLSIRLSPDKWIVVYLDLFSLRSFTDYEFKQYMYIKNRE